MQSVMSNFLHLLEFSSIPVPSSADERSDYLSVLWYCQRYFEHQGDTFRQGVSVIMVSKLPSDQTFCVRLNMLSEAFKVLVETMIQSFKPKDCDSIISIVDSMPIVTCKGKNRRESSYGDNIKRVLLH